MMGGKMMMDESSSTSFRESHEDLYGLLMLANQKIYNPEPEKDSGTTLTAGLLIGQRLFIAHVGDSRAYLLEHGGDKNHRDNNG